MCLKPLVWITSHQSSPVSCPSERRRTNNQGEGEAFMLWVLHRSLTCLVASNAVGMLELAC